MMKVDIDYKMDRFSCVCLMGEGADYLTESDIQEAIEDFIAKKRRAAIMAQQHMSRDEIKAWISACNNPAAKATLRQFLKLRSEGTFQARGAAWLEECFGESNDPLRKERRMHRFVEESIELAQALGCSKDDFLKLVDYVFGRAVGEPKQEVGGVMLTLVGVCVANGFDMMECGETELARVWTKVEAIRAKNARQVRGSPLPGADEPKNGNGIDVA